MYGFVVKTKQKFWNLFINGKIEESSLTNLEDAVGILKKKKATPDFHPVIEEYMLEDGPDEPEHEKGATIEDILHPEGVTGYSSVEFTAEDCYHLHDLDQEDVYHFYYLHMKKESAHN